MEELDLFCLFIIGMMRIYRYGGNTLSSECSVQRICNQKKVIILVCLTDNERLNCHILEIEGRKTQCFLLFTPLVLNLS
jgi:hypothetical protein